MSERVPISLGADDYGLAPGIDEGIVELLLARRLTAVSCMVTLPEWADAAPRLAPFSDRADLGLHLTLTDQQACTDGLTDAGGRLPTFGALWRAATLRRLDLGAVRAEVFAQLDAFEERMGRPPDHLDGHQHVQQLPGVRDIVIEAASRLGPGGWVRTCVERPEPILARGIGVGRAWLFSAAGAALAVGLHRAEIPTNRGFSGLYSFRGGYADALPRFLRWVEPGTAVLCHPGRVDDTLRRRDPLAEPRQAELDALLDPGFDAVLADAGVRLARLSRL